mgnify:CR=1 FL=1
MEFSSLDLKNDGEGRDFGPKILAPPAPQPDLEESRPPVRIIYDFWGR